MSGSLLLFVLGALPARAAREPLGRVADVSPGSSGVTVIPHGKREVRVSWTLRAWRSGARVLLYAGTSVGNGVPLAEVAALPGLNSYEYVDRSGRDGRWVYWLVVVEDHARRAVLGSLVCVSPSMDEGFAPAPPHLRAALAEVPRVEPPVRRWAPTGEPENAGDLLLEAPPTPPPERS